MMMNGVVKSYSDFNGYGFIAGDDGNDYYAHVSKIVGTDDRSIDTGDKVTFIPCQNKQGGYAAEIRIVLRGDNDKSVPIPFRFKKNPFTPQSPVTEVNKFAGRIESIYSAIDGMYNNKSILISGPRGIGKSSLSYQLLYLTSGEKELLTRCGIDGDDELFKNIICDYHCMPGNNLSDIASGLLSSLCNHLGVDLVSGKSTTFGIDLSIFSASHTDEYQPQNISDTLTAFAHQAEKLFSENSKDYLGITFLIDEIDVLDSNEPIAAFLKGAVEKFTLDSYSSFFFIISGIAGRVVDLIAQHPSVSRLFENIILPTLNDEELHELISAHLADTGVTATESAVSQIISYSNNFPHPVQLLGYYAFKYDTDNNIDNDDVAKAARYIASNLKQQEYDDKFGKLRTGKNITILRAMIKSKTPSVSISYLSKSCALDFQETAGILGDLISKGIIEKQFSNQYRFVEPLFSIYLKIIFDLG